MNYKILTPVSDHPGLSAKNPCDIPNKHVTSGELILSAYPIFKCIKTELGKRQLHFRLCNKIIRKMGKTQAICS